MLRERSLPSNDPFNPLDKANLGISVAQALLSKNAIPLVELGTFQGAGVYALYYIGSFKPYSRLAGQNNKGRFLAPIYVGKAENKRRKGISAGTSRSTVLYRRLNEHRESIRQASTTLSANDFYCRYLVVDDIWVPLGESLLIAKFTPVWNTLVDGFGNHDPGAGRHAGMRPRWDVLHPGRAWADRCQPRMESAKQIAADVEEFLRALPSEPPRFYAGEPLSPDYLVAQDDSEET